jgi:DNA-binding transcriptional LysR family regulator
MLIDRHVNLMEEGVDIALRIGHLEDSSMIAIRVGEVRRVVVAAPRYLKQHPRIEQPADLAKHQVITMTHFTNSWTFAPAPGSSVPRAVQFAPRIMTNSTRSAVASAISGLGVTRLFSYQVAEEIQRKELEVVLVSCEDPPMPVHVLSPHGRLSVPKVRAFTDFVVPRLRSQFARLASDLTDSSAGARA